MASGSTPPWRSTVRTGIRACRSTGRAASRSGPRWRTPWWRLSARWRWATRRACGRGLRGPSIRRQKTPRSPAWWTSSRRLDWPRSCSNGDGPSGRNGHRCSGRAGRVQATRYPLAPLDSSRMLATRPTRMRCCARRQDAGRSPRLSRDRLSADLARRRAAAHAGRRARGACRPAVQGRRGHRRDELQTAHPERGVRRADLPPGGLPLCGMRQMPSGRTLGWNHSRALAVVGAHHGLPAHLVQPRGAYTHPGRGGEMCGVSPDRSIIGGAGDRAGPARHGPAAGAPGRVCHLPLAGPSSSGVSDVSQISRRRIQSRAPGSGLSTSRERVSQRAAP